MSDIEAVVALLSKVSDQVGTTAAEAFAHLVRFELIQGYSLLGFGLALMLVGLFSAWKVWKITKSVLVVDEMYPQNSREKSEKMMTYTGLGLIALILSGVFLLVAIPQVFEPTGSVVSELVHRATK